MTDKELAGPIVKGLDEASNPLTSMGNNTSVVCSVVGNHTHKTLQV